MFSSQGPSLRELIVQALSSVEHGYDLLAPKFDRTPFRTPDVVLDATIAALAGEGPFDDGLDVCTGTGAGVGVLEALCRGRITGVDFSAGMLAEARAAHPRATWVRADARALPLADGSIDLAVTFGALGHFLPAERPAVFAGVHRALRPGGLFTFAMEARPPRNDAWYWATLGFDSVMRVRNTVWRPPFVMYYRDSRLPAVRADLTAAGFDVTAAELTGAGHYRDGSTRILLVLARKPGASGS
ncbi:class I SAM-dependent methyltransferase [Cryptosporangium phraense]|uniref:Methyltransferase domain-containing protein n=1 Tax=Cryptosporangium phraense TaxID=2593070 RepID=A0A545AXS4_9ACTN|nr:class I SAM-dependent methyltransferase [Cryptosporangium phraense]TQS46081.1 methyltransferase domain-containing protein [Cryptosporangium phraense]